MFAIQPNIHRNQKNCTLEINPPTPITPSVNTDESDLEPKEILNRYNLQIRESKRRAKQHALAQAEAHFSLHAWLNRWNRCCFG